MAACQKRYDQRDLGPVAQIHRQTIAQMQFVPSYGLAIPADPTQRQETRQPDPRQAIGMASQMLMPRQQGQRQRRRQGQGDSRQMRRPEQDKERVHDASSAASLCEAWLPR